jgi:tetratricopeptide (TPR) repeat protein
LCRGSLALEKLDAGALTLLTIFAFLAPDNIPRTLLDSMYDDKLSMNKVLASLRAYSLIQVGEESISLHRLVQYVVRDPMSPEAEETTARLVLQFLFKESPQPVNDPRNWPLLGRLQPHVQHVSRIAARLRTTEPFIPLFVLGYAAYLRMRENYAGARELLDVADQLGKVLDPPEDRVLRMVRLEDSALLRSSGSLEDALAEYRSRLSVEDLQPDDRAYLLTGAGIVLIELGQYRESADSFREVLKILDDLDTSALYEERAVAKANLGAALYGLRELEAAVAGTHGALELFGRLYGQENARMIPGLRLLSAIHQLQGDLDAAIRELRRALRISIEFAGEDAPSTAAIRARIAALQS